MDRHDTTSLTNNLLNNNTYMTIKTAQTQLELYFKKKKIKFPIMVQTHRLFIILNYCFC